jgi:hypothetical protein
LLVENGLVLSTSTEEPIQILPDGVKLSEDLDWYIPPSLEVLELTTVAVEVESWQENQELTVVIQITGTVKLEHTHSPLNSEIA